MITGDGNLLEVQGSVRYTIADPHIFLFEVDQPEKVLRNAAESVVREVVCGRRMAELLTADRGEFQREVLTRSQRRRRFRCRHHPELGQRIDAGVDERKARNVRIGYIQVIEQVLVLGP